MQNCSISIANALEILQSCTKPSISPSPDPSCLAPTSYNHRPVLDTHTTQSLTLILMPWLPEQQCQGISLPSVNYTLHYRAVTGSGGNPSCETGQPECQTLVSCPRPTSLHTNLKIPHAGLILGLHPANERWRYFVMTSLIGWAQTWNQPWHDFDSLVSHFNINTF